MLGVARMKVPCGESEASLQNQRNAWLLACCVVTLLSGVAAAAPAVVMFPALGSPERVTVTGRVYTDAGTSGSSTLSRNLRRLTASNWEGAPVKLRFGGVTQEVKSGKDGVFTATFEAPEGKPFPAGIGFVNLEAGERSARGRGAVEIIAAEAPFLVVSDFDDTLAVTNVRSPRALVQSALFRDSDSQPHVDGMSEFYACLREGKKATPGFALVSGSPEQFVPRTAKFLNRHRFPFFGMYLRNFGLNTMSGYKQPKIRDLLAAFPDKKFILVGDSGEHDPEVYAEIRKEFPDRIAAVYIRDAGRTELGERFEGMTLFDHPSVAARDAAKKGLLSAECLRKLGATER